MSNSSVGFSAYLPRPHQLRRLVHRTCFNAQEFTQCRLFWIFFVLTEKLFLWLQWLVTESNWNFVLSLTPFWRRSCHSRSCHSCRRSWSCCSCRSFRSFRSCQSCWSFQVPFNLATRLHKTWKIALYLVQNGTCTCWTTCALELLACRRDDSDGFGRTWTNLDILDK